MSRTPDTVRRTRSHPSISLSRAGFERLTRGLVKNIGGVRLKGVKARIDRAINAALDAESTTN